MIEEAMRRRGAIGAKVLVRLVDHQRDFTLQCKLVQIVEKIWRINTAGGIVRRHHRDRPSAWRQRSRHLIDRWQSPSGWIERHANGANPLHVQPHLVIEVIRQRQHHLVTGAGERVHRHAESLVATGGDRNPIDG